MVSGAPFTVTVTDVAVNVADPAPLLANVTTHVPAVVPVAHVSSLTLPGPLKAQATIAPSAGNGVDVPSPPATSTWTVNVCGSPARFVALGGVTDTDTDTHVFDAVAGALKPMFLNATPSTVVVPMAVTFNVRVPGPASSTVN